MKGRLQRWRAICLLSGLLLYVPVQANVLTLDMRGDEVPQEVFSLVAAPGGELRPGLAPEDAGALREGGLGRCYRTSRHGGFIHVDARICRARW
jgi:hypothetical protein